MKKKVALTKLKLNKEKIASLTQIQQDKIIGGIANQAGAQPNSFIDRCGHDTVRTR
jgi:hypothetical protein